MEETISSYKCTLCKKILQTNENLKSHIYKVHTNTKCDICNSSFRESRGLKRHKLSVHGPKKYNCIICQKSFARYDQAQGHLREVHEELKDYE